MPKISIIVPVYNVEKYLPRCLDSIIRQTFKDWECLVIDDGSTDTSGAICDEYARKDNRIKVFHKENGGVSTARNLGLDNACGEWIAFCDGDDAVESNWLDLMFTTGIKEQTQLVVCDFYEVTQKGMKSHSAWDYTGTHPYDPTLKYPEIINQALLYSWGVVWDLLIKNEFLTAHCIRFDEGISYSEDTVFFIKLLAYGIKVSYLDTPLYYYNRTNDSSVTQQLSKKNIANKIYAFKLLSATLNDLNIISETRLAMSDRLTSFALVIASEKQYHDLIISAMCPEYRSKIFAFRGGNIRAKVLLWLLTHNMRSVANIIILIYKNIIKSRSCEKRPY